MPEINVSHGRTVRSSIALGGDVLEGKFAVGVHQDLRLELDDDGVPEAIHIFPAEPFWHPAVGLVEVTRELLESFAANSRRYANDLLIDYEHQSIADPPVVAPAAGWARPEFEVREDGLWARIKEWTAQAKAHILAKEYRYLSPVFALSARSRKTGANIGPVVVCVGLTNVPQIDGMTPLVNRIRNGEVMNPMLLALLLALGLDETANEELALATIEKMKKPTVPEDLHTALELDEGADVVAACTAVQALKDQANAAEGRATQATAQLAAAKATTADAAAASVSLADHAALKSELEDLKVKMRVKEDGVAPAVQGIACTLLHSDEATYQEWLKSAPKVPVGEIRTPAKTVAGDGELTADELAVCKVVGVTPEAFKNEKKSLAAATA